MYCVKCGKEMLEDAAFCVYCSAKKYVPQLDHSNQIEDGLDEDSERDEESIDKLSEKRVFNFSKQKWIGNVVFKKIETHVELAEGILQIDMSVKRLFRSQKYINKIIPLNEIKYASTKTAMDFWDCLYAIIFAVLGIFKPILFIMTALCLFTGYGKEMVLYLGNGSKFEIPMNFASEAEGVLNTIQNMK